jgi:L-threonylcarbamoyladenylate synthase
VEKIFEAKGRSATKAMPVLLADPTDLPLVAAFILPEVEILAQRFWPGALTIVVPKSSRVPNLVTGGSPTIAVRVPNHHLALDLIRHLGAPLAGTSANRAGNPSPTTAAQVQSDLEGLIDVIIDGGMAPGGVESTVVDMTRDVPTVLRKGTIGVAEIEAALGRTVECS